MIEEYPEVYDFQVWANCDPQDLWVFDKLIVSTIAGHLCGPKGVYVPKPATYIVRPITNLYGMGMNARFIHLDSDTEPLNHGEFWCEVFTGRHLSVDYVDGKQVLAVEGFRRPDQPIQRFSRWEKVSDGIPLPKFLIPLMEKYGTVNCEYIGGKLIEVHLRRNPDFRYGNSVVIPKWPDEAEPEECSKMELILDSPDDDDDRIGVYIK